VVAEIELVGVETESEMSGLVKVVVSVIGAIEIRHEVIEELVVFIQLKVSEIVTIIERIKKNFKGAK